MGCGVGGRGMEEWGAGMEGDAVRCGAGLGRWDAGRTSHQDAAAEIPFPRCCRTAATRSAAFRGSGAEGRSPRGFPAISPQFSVRFFAFRRFFPCLPARCSGFGSSIAHPCGRRDRGEGTAEIRTGGSAGRGDGERLPLPSLRTPAPPPTPPDPPDPPTARVWGLRTPPSLPPPPQIQPGSRSPVNEAEWRRKGARMGAGTGRGGGRNELKWGKMGLEVEKGGLERGEKGLGGAGSE